MVKSILMRLSQLVSLLLITTLVHSETSVTLSIDKNKIFQNEILNLTVQANTELELSLGGLMNFGGSQVEEPKFEGLEQNWEVVDRQQSYNMQSINGNAQSTITWRYALAPKTQGIVQIPPARFKDAESDSLSVEVVSGSRPRDAANPPLVFLKASVDKSTPYLQEQVIYSLKLFTLGEARGDMSEPAHPDLIIEPLGDTTKTYEMEFNRRYEVYERQYLIFPQRSGTIDIDAQEFTGNLVDPRSLRRMRARELSNRITLNVKAPPTGFSGDTWLPATSLFLSDSIEPETDSIRRGDSITRTINMTALGLLGSALPELPVSNISELKVYPDQPQIDSIEHGQGVQSSRKETRAYVAIKEGNVELPSLEIVWWDTVNDIERIAKLPARTLTIQGTSLASDAPGDQSATTVDIANPEDSTALAASEVDDNIVPTEPLSSHQDSNSLWPALLATVVLLWLAHVLFLYRRLNQFGKPAPAEEIELPDIEFESVLGAVKSRQPDASILVRRWLQQRRGSSFLTQAQLESIDPLLPAWLNLLESEHFSGSDQNAQMCAFKRAAEDLASFLISYEKKQTKTVDSHTNASALKPFYPT